eukprot:TRINITY_DN8657_c0_g1_i1.p1 TRINITY_DN8657_c0_g1~~TRINITY_DN8657_c0_g1_i1.p1  ORF type:complete len:1461 (-),score=280.53 TRINITY_DN8657_c0_g1_i1:179-4561(-)
MERKNEETMTQLLDRLKACFRQWCCSAEKDEDDSEHVLDLFLQERLFDNMPKDICQRVKEFGPKNATQTAEFATQCMDAKRAAQLISGEKRQKGGQGSNGHGGRQPGQEKYRGQGGKDQQDSQFPSVLGGTESDKSGDGGPAQRRGGQARSSGPKCYICEGDHVFSRCPQWKGPKGGPYGNKAKVYRAATCADVTYGDQVTPPSLCTTCADKPYDPRCVVTVNGCEVMAIRDTGATHCVVEASLVQATDYTGEFTEMITVSGQVYQVPIAEVDLVSPFVAGRMAVLVLEKPNQPVLIGNYTAAHWSGEPTKIPVYANPTYVMQVQTRTQARAQKELPQRLPVKGIDVDIKPEELVAKQQQDPSLDGARRLANSGASIRKKSGRIRFSFQNRVLVREYSTQDETIVQVCVPRELRGVILRVGHDQPMAAHLGSRKTLERIRRDFYWPGVSQDVKKFCRSCPVCQKTVDKGRVPPVPLVRTPVEGQPFDKVGVDLIGPIIPRSRGGNKYILVQVDYVTRYPEAVPLRNMDATTVAEKLFEIWSRTGIPKVVLTDRGSQFTSGIMKGVYQILGIKGCTTTPYHAQANGLVERFNGTLKKMLRRLATEKPQEWDRWIPAALFAYREVPQATTGYSPFQMLYGREVRGITKVIKDMWLEPDADDQRTLAQYLVDLKTQIHETCQIAKRALAEAGHEQKRQFDKKTRNRQFTPGQRVLLLRPQKHNKMELAWKGPYKVIARQNEVDYLIQVERGRKMYHANLLKLFYERERSKEEPTDVGAVNSGIAMNTTRPDFSKAPIEKLDHWDLSGYHLATVLWSDEKPSVLAREFKKPVLEIWCVEDARGFKLTKGSGDQSKDIKANKQEMTKEDYTLEPQERLFYTLVWAIQSCKDQIEGSDFEVWVDQRAWDIVLGKAHHCEWTPRMLGWAHELLPYQWKFRICPVPKGRSQECTGVRAGDVLPDTMAKVLQAVVIEEDGDSIPILTRDIPVIPLQATETYEDTVVRAVDPSFAREIRDLLSRYPEVFSDLPGTTNLEECTITLKDEHPVRCKPYPVPYAQRETVKEEVKAMLDMGVIEPSVSPYASPIVLVKKIDGKIRFCVDYRRLNKSVEFDTEPIPEIEYLFAKLGKQTVLSKIDLAKGYWQIPIPPEDRPKTAFLTPQGCFQWKVMPFGLSTSGAVFTRMMRKLLLPLQSESIDNFIDDILVATETQQEHLEVLRGLLERLKECKLKARPSKCEFGCRELEYLGHMIGEGKIWPAEDKMRKIRTAARPETKTQVKSFLGLVGYYRKFVPNFSDIAVPLIELTKKGKPRQVEWSAECQEAFEELKNKFCTPPIHRLPKPGGMFYLRTDASETGIGAILFQQQEGEIFPLACASKKLNQAERNYPTIEKECLAVKWGIEKFALYLHGTEFVVQTDQAPLTALDRLKSASGRCTKWALQLQPFKFRVEAIPGRDNQAADFLSRLKTD